MKTVKCTILFFLLVMFSIPAFADDCGCSDILKWGIRDKYQFDSVDNLNVSFNERSKKLLDNVSDSKTKLRGEAIIYNIPFGAIVDSSSNESQFLEEVRNNRLDLAKKEHRTITASIINQGIGDIWNKCKESCNNNNLDNLRWKLTQKDDASGNSTFTFTLFTPSSADLKPVFKKLDYKESELSIIGNPFPKERGAFLGFVTSILSGKRKLGNASYDLVFQRKVDSQINISLKFKDHNKDINLQIPEKQHFVVGSTKLKPEDTWGCKSEIFGRGHLKRRSKIEIDTPSTKDYPNVSRWKLLITNLQAFRFAQVVHKSNCDDIDGERCNEEKDYRRDWSNVDCPFKGYIIKEDSSRIEMGAADKFILEGNDAIIAEIDSSVKRVELEFKCNIPNIPSGSKKEYFVVYDDTVNLIYSFESIQ